MRKLIAILIALGCLQSISAQSHNRRVMIDMILSNSRHSFKSNPDQKVHFYSLQEAPAPACFMRVDAIPKFQLPRCSVVCRFEEYVQLHSPFKLNIGVGGE